jgi:hypothetical protein
MPPLSWTTRSAPVRESGRIASTGASSVALHDDIPTMSPPVSVISRYRPRLWMTPSSVVSSASTTCQGRLRIDPVAPVES